MFPQDFEKFITATDEALMVKHPHKDPKLHALSRVAKLAEEFGELSSEVLSSLEMQRKSKLSRTKRENLEKEWSDTFFSLILLAMTLDIPIKDAVQKRMSTITQRIKKSAL